MISRLRTLSIIIACFGLVAALPGVVAAHEGSAKAGVLDHDPPGFDPDAFEEPSGEFHSGGDGAAWESLGTIFTGNPHTDFDFFTQDGEIYLAAGTLGVGLNRGGQTFVQVTQDGEVDPTLVSSHPSAGCLVDYSRALGLQHDVQVYPKGDIPLHVDFGALQDRRDAQIVVDATDAQGRCHDQGPIFGFEGGPQGGLEIIDITDIENPVEIALTSHIGEAHTVTMDPTRPIAYAASSDTVQIVEDEDTGEEIRANEDPDGQPMRLDGFEVVDLSSCIDFPDGATVEDKRGIVDGEFTEDGCRPDVYRYRFEIEWTRGTYDHDWVGACHDLEVYPDDRLVCAGLNGTLILDMSGAFDEGGSPNGEPLDCSVRESSNAGPTEPWSTEAPVIDCVEGEDGKDLRIPAWIEDGAPSLEGVEMVGFVNHGGRDAEPPSHHPSEDIQISHEVEFSTSGDFIIVSDERGGAVLPPGAACAPDEQWPGNGGLHAFRVDQLYTEYPAVLDEDGNIDGAATAERAREAYALTSTGEQAIHRAQVRVPSETLCTAHVFRHVPGQNRIFMAWYTQGTQVVDYTEYEDGTFEFSDAGYYIPVNANQWVSHAFMWEENEDGTFTYYGAAADFQLGEQGRNSIDFYAVTLPPPPETGPQAVLDPADTVVERFAGSDRHATACMVAEETFRTANTVVLTRSDFWADTLAGNYLAGQLAAPVLITAGPGHPRPNEVDAVTARCLEELGTEEIVILGGPEAVSPAVQEELEADGYAVTRIGGADRHETAYLVATGDEDDRTREYGQTEGGRTAIVTRADEFVDALSAGGVSYDGWFPLLLTPPDSLDEQTERALDALDIEHVVISGGEDAVSSTVEAQIQAKGISTERWGETGPSRLSTATDTADWAAENLGGWDRAHVNLVRGDLFPDALTIGSHAGAEAGGIVLNWNPGTLGEETRAWLEEHACEIHSMHIGGGTSAVSSEVENDAKGAADACETDDEEAEGSSWLGLAETVS